MVNQLWTSIADAGRELLRGRLGGRRRSVAQLCVELLSTRGEASGAALAREVVDAYRAMADSERLAFFKALAADYAVDPEAVNAAAGRYAEAPGSPRSIACAGRRIAAARAVPADEHGARRHACPGPAACRAARAPCRPRRAGRGRRRPAGAAVGWFNPGFLSLSRIDWNSPAALLEKLVRYERVHRMQGLEDLRRRLAADRRCFAFFHPALPDEPLIFVQVALVDGLADRIQPLIDAHRPDRPGRARPTRRSSTRSATARRACAASVSAIS